MKYPNYLRLFICLLFVSFASITSRASHIVGADLRYEWVSGNTYKIIVSFYGDCGPASAGAFATLPTGAPKVCVFKGSATTATTTLTLAVDSPSAGIEITPLATFCGSTVSQCTNPASPVPGIKLFHYSTTYTFPDTSSLWRLVFSGNYGTSSAGRAAAISNLSGATTMQLVDTLNNAIGHNSNPVLNVNPLPYYSINTPQLYNPIAIDAEGDSLRYTLTPATNGTGACSSTGVAVTYSSGLSYSAPLLTSAGGFSFNAATGDMNFYPNALQRAVVVYNIREYRSGVLVGSIQRELTVLTLAGANHMPGGKYDSSTVGTVVDSVNYSICVTAGAFTASIHAHDTDATDTITVVPVGLPTGATFNTVDNSTPHPVSTFSWNTTGLTPGTYTFYVIYNDNGCPVTHVDTIGYHVTITPAPCTSSAGNEIAVAQSGISLYPNPGTGTFAVDMPTGIKNAEVAVYDVYGRKVYERATIFASNKVELDLTSLAQGTYMLKISAGGKVYREKMVIAK